MKRAVIVLLMASVLALCVTAQTRLTFMGWGQPSEVAIFNKMIAKFQTANPGIKVDYTSVDPAQFVTKLTTMVAANKAPDVFYVRDGEFIKFVRSSIIEDLTPFLDKARGDFSRENIWPQAIMRYSYDGRVVGKGKLYALPKDLGPYPMVYNKDLLSAAGVPFPDPDKPMSWDQFLDACKKLTKDTNGDGKIDQFGAAFIPMEAAVWSAGGNWLSADRTKVTIDTPEFIKGLQLYVDISLKYHYAPNAEESSASSWWERWLVGKVAFAGMGPWDQPTFWSTLKFDWDIAQWPMDARTGVSRNWLGSMGIAVSTKSANKQKAFELASFLTLDADGQRELYTMGQMVPNIISQATGEFLKFEKKPAHRKVFIDYIQKYSAPAAGWGCVDSRWLDTFFQDVAEVTSGKIGAAEWVKKEQPKIQKLYDEGGNAP